MPEEAAVYPWTDLERGIARQATASHVVGSPETVRRGLQELLDATGADELMVTTNVHAHADRVRSYELLAELAADLRAPAPRPAVPDRRVQAAGRAASVAGAGS